MDNYNNKNTGLSYHYSKGVQTLFDINLNVEKGSIYGFLVQTVPEKQQH